MNGALLALVGIVLAAVPVLLRKPVWSAFGASFLLLIHLNLVLSSQFSIDLADPVLFGALLGLVAVYPLLHGDTALGTGRFLAAVGLWLAAVLNSYVWSTTAGVTVQSLREALPNLLYAGVVFLLVTDRARLIAALAGLLAATVFLSALTVVQVALNLTDFHFFGLANGAFDHIAGGIDALRPTGPVKDPNYYCQILIPGFGLALGMAMAGGRLSLRAAGIAATILIAITIMLTASRGGMLAAAVTATGLLFAYRKVQYLALLVVPVLGLLYFEPTYYERLASLTTSVVAIASGQVATESSVSGRLAEMQAAAILFSSHPVAGIGYGTFESRYQDISANYDMVLRGSDRSAHSLYLETAAEQGVVGLAALLFLLGSSLRALQLAYRNAVSRGDRVLILTLRAMGPAAAGLFASSVFLHDAYAQHLWLVLALLFATERATDARQHDLQLRVSTDD